MAGDVTLTLTRDQALALLVAAMMGQPHDLDENLEEARDALNVAITKASGGHRG